MYAKFPTHISKQTALRLQLKVKALVLLSIWGRQQRLRVSSVDYQHVQICLEDGETRESVVRSLDVMKAE